MAETSAGPKLDEEVALGLPPSLLLALDQWATQAGLSREEAIRHLLESALQRFKGYAPISDPE